MRPTGQKKAGIGNRVSADGIGKPPGFARSEALLCAGLLAAAAALRLLYLAVYAREMPYFRFPLGDADIYLAWARDIIAGHIVGPGVFYRAPLYAYILAGLLGPTGGSLLAVYLVQTLLGLGTLVLVYLTARRLAGRAPAAIALALAVLAPTLPFFETKLLSASWVVFLVMLAGFLLVLARGEPGQNTKTLRHQVSGSGLRTPGIGQRRSIWLWVGAGLSYGAAVLAWPGAGFVLLAAVVFAALDRRSGWRRALLLAACAAAAVMPATVHNLAADRGFVPVSANSGFTFYQGNNRLAVGTLAQPPEVYEFQKDGRYLTGISDQEAFEQEYTRSRFGRELKPSAVSRFWFGRAFGWMARDPGGFAKLLLRKLGLAFSDYESPLNYNLDMETALVWPLRALVARFGVLLALAAVALVFAFRRRDWPIYAPVAGTVAGLLVFYVSSRYRVLAVPALAVLGGSGLALLWDRARRRRGLLAPVVVGLAVFAVSRLALVAPLRRGSMLLVANGFRNMGETFHLRAQDRARAEYAYRRATELQETYADPRSMQERVALEETRQLLARLLGRPDAETAERLKQADELLATGDTAGAVTALRSLIAADSGARQAYMVLGSVFGARGRHEDAREVFSLAAGRFPHDPVVLYNLALSSLNAGDRRAAVEAAQKVMELVPGHPWAQEVIARAKAPEQ